MPEPFADPKRKHKKPAGYKEIQARIVALRQEKHSLRKIAELTGISVRMVRHHLSEQAKQQPRDQHASIVLPDDFANETVVVERVGPNELRLHKKKSLSQLITDITPEPQHGEWDTGSAVGGEVV